MRELTMQDINQIPMWKGNINQEYLKELTYYFKILRTEEED